MMFPSKNPRVEARNNNAPDYSNSFNGLGLFIVTGATAISGTSYRWLYQIKPAAMKDSTTAPDYGAPYVLSTAPTTGFNAVSISELGNDMNSPKKYAYGISEGSLTGTFTPVRIPDNTPVIAMPYRADSGTARYIIINTQALDGECP